MMEQFCILTVVVSVQISMCDKRHRITHCANAGVLAVKLPSVRCPHWGKLGKGYVGSLCTIFAAFCESIIINKKKSQLCYHELYVKNLTVQNLHEFNIWSWGILWPLAFPVTPNAGGAMCSKERAVLKHVLQPGPLRMALTTCNHPGGVSWLSLNSRNSRRGFRFLEFVSIHLFIHLSTHFFLGIYYGC